MKTLPFALALCCAALVAACGNPQRSRDLGNPGIAAQTLAQQVCSNCHGVTGNSVSPNFPNLAGQTAPYTTAQLTEFKGHSRQDPAGFEYMWGISRALSAEQIQGLADYYAAQPLAPLAASGKATNLAAGKLVFEAGASGRNVMACVLCHGDRGQGNGPIPRLAGQHADYLVKQLMVFQRTNQRPEGSVMKTVAHGLTRQEIENVAIYTQSLTYAVADQKP